MSDADYIDVTNTRVWIQDPDGQLGPDRVITSWRRGKPATVSVRDQDPDLARGDVVEMTKMSDSSGHYVVTGTDANWVSLATDWRDRVVRSEIGGKINKGAQFIADNFCELQSISVAGATYDSREYQTFCGKLTAPGTRTDGTVTLTFLFNPNKKIQQALNDYDDKRGKFWIKLEFPNNYGLGFFHGSISTALGIDGSAGEAWTATVTIQQDMKPVFLGNPEI